MESWKNFLLIWGILILFFSGVLLLDRFLTPNFQDFPKEVSLYSKNKTPLKVMRKKEEVPKSYWKSAKLPKREWSFYFVDLGGLTFSKWNKKYSNNFSEEKKIIELNKNLLGKNLVFGNIILIPKTNSQKKQVE